MNQIFHNKVTITNVHNKHSKQFAFGVVLEPKPRIVFFPHWIIRAFDITSADQGSNFDCLFIDQPDDKNPVVLAIIDDEVLENSAVVGQYLGKPGTPDFSAIVNELNRRAS